MYYLVDIVLFLLALFVIIFYRFLDKKDRQIHLVKTYIDRMKQELVTQEKSMQASFEQIAGEIDEKGRDVRAMLRRVDQSLADLEAHAGDLNELQTYMSHYHRILKELSELTEKAERRLSRLQQEYDALEQRTAQAERLEQREQELEAAVGSLRADLERHRGAQIEALDARSAGEFRKELDAILTKSESRLAKSSMAFEREYDNAVEAFQKRVDKLLDEAKETIESQLSTAVDQLNDHPSYGKRPSSSSLYERRSDIQVDWEKNNINREVSSAAAEFYRDTAAAEEKPAGAGAEELPDHDPEHIEFFDMIDEDPEDDNLPPGEEQDDDVDEDHRIFDDVDVHESEELPDEGEERVQDADHGEDAEDEAEIDDDLLDRIYYEEDEQIILDDGEDEDDDEGDTPFEEGEDDGDEPAPVVSPEKRRVVEEHLREGFSVSDIEELTEIPRGEIELIRELLNYS